MAAPLTLALDPQFGAAAQARLAGTSANAPQTPQAKARAQAEDFEAVFINSMFQHMFTAIDGDGPFGNGPGVGIWRSFLTERIFQGHRQGRRHRPRRPGLQIPAVAAGSPHQITRNAMLRPLATPETQPRPLASHADAQQAIDHLSAIMDGLLELVEEETRLVRAGKLSDVTRLEPSKSELARHYIADVTRLKASQPYLEQTLPAALDALRARHDRFRALLQINLTVLATAHAVSEGIMRGVSNEINRKSMPQTYGASGRQTTPTTRHAAPLTLSRAL